MRFLGFIGRGFPLTRQQVGVELGGIQKQQEMALRGVGRPGFFVALPPPSFEDWICTPNAETYQEYLERRLPESRNTSTTPDPEQKES